MLDGYSFSVVKIKANETNRVIGTGLLIGVKYVITSLNIFGAKKLDKNDIAEYEVITRDSEDA
jgi:hypothetical protein